MSTPLGPVDQANVNVVIEGLLRYEYTFDARVVRELRASEQAALAEVVRLRSFAIEHEKQRLALIEETAKLRVALEQIAKLESGGEEPRVSLPVRIAREALGQ